MEQAATKMGSGSAVTTRQPLIIEAAINGATPKAMNSHVPRTVPEIGAARGRTFESATRTSRSWWMPVCVEMARRSGRAVATPGQAAEILGVRPSVG
jgi:hypothetical protein